MLLWERMTGIPGTQEGVRAVTEGLPGREEKG